MILCPIGLSKLGLLFIFAIVMAFSLRLLMVKVFDFIELVLYVALGLLKKWVVYATTTPSSGSSGGSNSNPSGGNSPNGAGNNPGNGGGGNPGGNDPVVVATAPIAVDLFQVEFHSIVVEPIDEAKRNLLSDFNAEATTKPSGSVIKKTP